MNYKVINKQHNSKKCFVCGLDNQMGLKAAFYEIENNELVAIIKPVEEHQSYPNRLHGGVSGAILDETIGRAIMIKHPNVWGVTVEINIKYRKPIPLNQELRVVGRIIKDSSRLFEGTGEILLANGEVAAEAHGKYMKMPIEKIADVNGGDFDWKLVNSERDPENIEL